MKEIKKLFLKKLIDLEGYFQSLDLNEKNSFKLSETIINLVDEFTHHTYKYGTSLNDQQRHEINNETLCTSSWSNCSYTIQVIEQLLAIEQSNKMTLKQENLLSNLVKQAYMTTNSQRETNQNVKNLFGLLFDEENTKINDFSLSISLAECDVFHYLVSLTLSSECGNMNKFYLFKLMLQLQSIQILINLMLTNKTTTNANELLNYLSESLKQKSLLINQTNLIDLNQLTTSLKTNLMPFLRCSAIFFSYFNDITQQVELAEDFSNNLTDFSKLINHLGIDELDFEQLVLNINNESLVYLIDR